MDKLPNEEDPKHVPDQLSGPDSHHGVSRPLHIGLDRIGGSLRWKDSSSKRIVSLNDCFAAKDKRML